MPRAFPPGFVRASLRACRAGFAGKAAAYRIAACSAQSNPWDSDIEVAFFGTSAGVPSSSRNVSSLGVWFRQRADMWLFDCGEGTQHQVRRGRVRPKLISRVFLTHLHGDHVWGLPGLLMSVMTARDEPVRVYGPRGTYALLSSIIAGTYTGLDSNIMVTELDFENTPFPRRLVREGLPRLSYYIHPGTGSISCESVPFDATRGEWVVDDSEADVPGGITVSAIPLHHRVPSVGYILKESDIAGELDASKLLADGLPPGPHYRELKSGKNVKWKNGRVYRASDYVGPATPGRKIVVLGDRDSRRLADYDAAYDADLLVHECTMDESLHAKSEGYGHSSPAVAGEFARDFRARCLALNHFSGRYGSRIFNKYGARTARVDVTGAPPDPWESSGSGSEAGLTIEDLAAQTRSHFGAPHVVASADFMSIPIQRRMHDTQWSAHDEPLHRNELTVPGVRYHGHVFDWDKILAL